MKQTTRVASGLLALSFLGVAIYFGVTGSWLNAILFFFIFGGLEFAVWAFGESDIESRKRER